MAPKKAAAAPAGPALPTPEEPVELPEGAGPAPDPGFAFSLVHVVEAPFSVEGEAAAAEEAPPLKEHCPCQLMVARLKHDAPPEEPLDQRLLVVEREELRTLGEPLGGSLARGLRLKVERESAARRQRKINRARRRAIAAAAGEEPPAEPPPAEPPVGLGAAGLDLVLFLADYPSTLEEVDEVVAEGVFDLPDAWVSAFLSGSTVVEEEGHDAASPEAGEAPPARRREGLAPPPALARLYDAIHEADVGSGLANSTICTLRGVDALAASASQADRAGDEAACAVAVGASLLRSVLDAAGQEAEQRLRFRDWLSGAGRLPDVPAAGATAGSPPSPDLQLYQRLADAIDVSHQDVPSLLHCLCEQVAATVDRDRHDEFGGPNARLRYLARPDDGGDGGGGAAGELQLLEDFLDGAHAQLMLGDLPGQEVLGASTSACVEDVGFIEGAAQSGTLGGLEDGSLVLPYLDKASCLHAGDGQPGCVSLVAEVQRLLSHLQLPGVGRRGFPGAPPLTVAQRSALRNRFYALLPQYSVVEIERMLLLSGFEALLQEAQPERSCRDCLEARTFHEKVPAALLAQVLSEAVRQEYFLKTRYDERHDSLLIVLYCRSLPGRCTWHHWHGDLRAEDPDAAGLCCEPSFNDWRELVAAGDGALPEAPAMLAGADARAAGYCRVEEQVVYPSDGSAVLKTSLMRGLRETFPRPSANEEAADFEAPPRHQLASTRVLKEGLAFGLATDEAWGRTVEELRAAREVRGRTRAEAEEAAAAAAAAREEAESLRRAQGLPPAEDEHGGAAADEVPIPPPEPAPGSPSERRLEDLCFGHFWAAFRDGARCSARLLHERPWYTEGATLCDAAAAAPGVNFVYTPASGFTVQVLPDGSVGQSWPPQRCAERLRQRWTGDAAGARPGGPGDVEVSRLVSAAGVVTCERLSGRREVYHPDGTRSFRNPSALELRSRAETRRAAGEEGTLMLRFLDAMVAAYGSQADWYEAGVAPPRKAKAEGLPGHWVVVGRGGRAFGRAPLPTASAAGPGASKAAAAAPGEEGADAAAEGAAAAAEAAAARAPSAEDEANAMCALLDGRVLMEEGVIEYEVQHISVTTFLDPHTGQEVSTSSDALTIVVAADEASHVIVLADGTRITSRPSPSQQVSMEHGELASVSCSVEDLGGHGPATQIAVLCAGGTELQVRPQMLQASRLLPIKPSAFDESTNASVLLRRPEGGVILSKGSGEVSVVGECEAAAMGEVAALEAADNADGVYLVNLDGDRIALRDSDGTFVLVHGDQTMQCRQPGREEASRPPSRGQPLRAQGAEGAEALPPPEGVMAPRLFVVHGDGEAEELLPAVEARGVLRRAQGDPEAIVTLGEPLGSPLECCRCHTIQRIVAADAPTVPVAAVELPPTVAGSCDGPGLGAGGQRTYTQLRQFIEYPAVGGTERSDFLDARARFDAREAEQRALHEGYGAGLRCRRASCRGSLKDPSPAEGGA